MADETRATTEPHAVTGAHTHAGEIRAHADVEATIEPHPEAIQTDDPGVARAEIERTRARMSETIDEIEGKLLHKKGQIESRLDVLRPVRERPLPALGVVLGAGVLVGLLTGGDDGHHEERLDADERADMWEHRARRLLRIAQEQEDQLERLETGRSVRRRLDAEEQDEEEPRTALHDLGDTIVERVSDYVTSAVKHLLTGTTGARI